MRAMGSMITPIEARKIIRGVDTDKNGTLDLDEVSQSSSSASRNEEKACGRAPRVRARAHSCALSPTHLPTHALVRTNKRTHSCVPQFIILAKKEADTKNGLMAKLLHGDTDKVLDATREEVLSLEGLQVRTVRG